tara:strand:+ start:887 stop:1672 length:786 start_codon:yes stop_codon:yes gene_type:complete
MSSIKVIKQYMESDDFIQRYNDYRKSKDNSLQLFLDNIDLNKKYYRMNINKNKKYTKVTTEDTSSIKEINSMINKITDQNYEILKQQIIQKITVDHIVPYIIQKLTESSIKHHIYIPLYVGILKEIKSTKKNLLLLKLCNKYYTEFFHDYNQQENKDTTNYEKLCDMNKNIDNIIGFSLFISYLEKEDILDNFIGKVLDPFMNYLSFKNDVELYKMLLSFENIADIHYQIIPQRYQKILQKIKETSASSKIRFKIMDILKE